MLKIICTFCYKHNINDDKYYAIFNSLRALFINFQKVEMMNDDYLKEFQGKMATLEDYNANIVDLVPCLLKEWVKEQYNKELENATDNELLIGADQGWYGSLKNQLQLNMAMGANNYPKSVDETMNILNTFAKTLKSNGSQRKGAIKQDNTEVAFAQKESKK